MVTVAKVADSLERTASIPYDEADRRLRSLPGVGVWTSAEVRQRAFGDPDAVSFGDYHVAKDVGWALTGTPFDDVELEQFLEPWRPAARPGPAAGRDGWAAPPEARAADGASDPPARGLARCSAQSIGRSGRRISSVNRRCRSRASHSPWVSSMQLDWSSSQTYSSTWARSRSMTSTLIS